MSGDLAVGTRGQDGAGVGNVSGDINTTLFSQRRGEGVLLSVMRETASRPTTGPLLTRPWASMGTLLPFPRDALFTLIGRVGLLHPSACLLNGNVVDTGRTSGRARVKVEEWRQRHGGGAGSASIGRSRAGRRRDDAAFDPTKCVPITPAVFGGGLPRDSCAQCAVVPIDFFTLRIKRVHV